MNKDILDVLVGGAMVGAFLGAFGWIGVKLITTTKRVVHTTKTKVTPTLSKVNAKAGRELDKVNAKFQDWLDK